MVVEFVLYLRWCQFTGSIFFLELTCLVHLLMQQQFITSSCLEILELLLQVELQTDLSKVCAVENSVCKVAPWVLTRSQAGPQEMTVPLEKESPMDPDRSTVLNVGRNMQCPVDWKGADRQSFGGILIVKSDSLSASAFVESPVAS